jgi:peptide/nickel transport system substrate-binding protein
MINVAGLLGTELESGETICDATTLCESWTVSDDGLVYTFTLKDGWTWSDGTPIDSKTYLDTYNAIASDNVDSPRKYVWDGIASIEAPDATTVVVTYERIQCDALGNLGSGLIPSHLYAEDFSDMNESPENSAPTVGFGPFKFQSWERDDNVIVTRADSWIEGVPNMDGMILRVVPDAGARLAMLESGEADILAVQPNQVAAVDANPNLTRYTWKDDGYVYVGMNYANPDNALDGLDAEGNVIAQDPHPILGDKAVRQAIAQAIDYDAIIRDIYFDQGFRQTANVVPAITWAYNADLEPYNYNIEAANALLEGAGWVDSDGDGVREKDGVAMNLELLTNAGNSTRENLGVYMQDALADIGIAVDFQAIDFGTLLERMDSQSFDMYIIGWTGLGTDPADYAFFHSNQDIVGSGFNNISYFSERYEELSAAGNSVPGCAPEDRAQYYKEIQEVIKEDVPYIFITGTQSNVAYNKNWVGIEPHPWSGSSNEPVYWNVHAWYLPTLSD